MPLDGSAFSGTPNPNNVARQRAAQQMLQEQQAARKKETGGAVQMGGTLLGALIGTLMGNPVAGAQVGGAAGTALAGVVDPSRGLDPSLFAQAAQGVEGFNTPELPTPGKQEQFKLPDGFDLSLLEDLK